MSSEDLQRSGQLMPIEDRPKRPHMKLTSFANVLSACII